MAEIGQPEGEPFYAPAPWEYPEPVKEPSPSVPAIEPAEPEKEPVLP